MKQWRIALGLLLALLIGAPSAAPFFSLFADPTSWNVWSEFDRLRDLAANTALLVGGVLALSVPTGITLAFFLYRTDLPGRLSLRFLVFLGLFVPLPLTACGWQAAWGFLPAGGPWIVRFPAAIWLHALSNLPWIVLIVGHGLLTVERELEEDALTAAGPWRVAIWVSVPRSAVAIAAAIVWVALQTANEITVTDQMQIRTFAEEIYTQFVTPEQVIGGRGDPSARARAAAVPWIALFAIGASWFVHRWERTLPAGNVSEGPRLFALGRARWFVTAACGLVPFMILGIPAAALVLRAGQGGGSDWSAAELVKQLGRACRADGSIIGFSLVTAAAAGLLASSLALMICWLAREARFFRMGVLVFLSMVWAVPGPVLGIGLKDTIHCVLDLTGSTWIANVLYFGPSALPLVWVDLLRFLPLATALIWPVVRLLPSDLIDAARLDGAAPRHEFREIIWPLTRGTWAAACLAVAVLSLGELSAGKLVATPGRPGYAHELFARMHFGVTPDLAAGSLLLLFLVGASGAVMIVLWTRLPNRAAARSACR